MTGILQSRCQFRNIVWFVRDLSHVFAFEGEGGGASICTFLSIYPTFFCQFCPKKWSQKGNLQASKRADLQNFPLPPPLWGPHVDTRCQLTRQQNTCIRP